MHIPRIYQLQSLEINQEITLSREAHNHVKNVLRMKIGQRLTLFNGNNKVFDAKIIYLDKRIAQVKLLSSRVEDLESPIGLHLGQVLSRGEKMEFTIQKSIELGVNIITPLFSDRCGIVLSAEKRKKKISNGKKSPLPPVSSAAEIVFLKFDRPCRY